MFMTLTHYYLQARLTVNYDFGTLYSLIGLTNSRLLPSVARCAQQMSLSSCGACGLLAYFCWARGPTASQVQRGLEYRLVARVGSLL
jgi:hypothetical protein